MLAALNTNGKTIIRAKNKKKFAKNFGLPKKSTSNQIYDFIVSDNFKKLPSKSRIMDGKGIKRSCVGIISFSWLVRVLIDVNNYSQSSKDE